MNKYHVSQKVLINFDDKLSYGEIIAVTQVVEADRPGVKGSYMYTLVTDKVGVENIPESCVIGIVIPAE